MENVVTALEGGACTPAPNTALNGTPIAPETGADSQAPSAETRAPSAEPLAHSTADWLDALLRHPLRLIDGFATGAAGHGVARLLVGVVLAGGAAFGGAVGLFHGGWQIAAAAIKVPLVLLLTACVVAPTLTTLRRSLQGAGHWQRDLGLVLACLARAGLVQLALAPLLILGSAVTKQSYHESVLVVAGSFALSAAAALWLFARVLWRDAAGARLTLAGIFLTVFCLVLAQLAWAGRPYLVRPRDPDPPFLRAVEGSPWQALEGSLRSARGDYWREAAPLDD
jgi:hypothetical protein